MNDKIAKLPIWAQDYIRKIEREREVAIRALNDYTDESTPSPFYVDEPESTGEQAGPSFKRRYIQTHKIAVEWKGVLLEIYLHQDENEIDIGWSDLSRQLKHVAFVPVSFNRAQLIAKENMR
jgi:hypothetical protein